MTKDAGIVRYTAEELAERLARGEDASDWARVRDKTEGQLAADTAGDPAWSGIDDAWIDAAVTTHNRLPDSPDKRSVTVHFDSDVIAYFQLAGRAWEDHMNAVLRRYMDRELQPH